MATKSKLSPGRIILSIGVLLVAAYFGVDLTNSTDGTPLNPSVEQSNAPAQQSAQSASSTESKQTQSIADTQRDLVSLAKSQRSGEMVEFRARVVKILNDDNEGSRHQRFLLAVDYEPSPTDSILVAHNIDLAPRVPVEEGSVIRIYGQYEWNDRGGVIHWTHHDPRGRHAEGWIELDGIRYD
ncbi:MAG: DUF3465 domain-containing protein [Phycisphaerales bacterium]|nr:DUF3465 domain-containing protein [Phycisphaerales bacterium]